MRSSFLLIISFIFLFSACASETAYKEHAAAAKEMAQGYYKASEKPLLDLKLPAPEGKEYHLVVNREVKQVELKQIKDSEWVAPVQALINTTGIVTGAAVIAQGAGIRTETVGGDKFTGTQEKPVTTTTTTEMLMPESTATVQ
jgi:hypothetical protein